MPKIKVSSAKAKGRNLQNWVAKKISELIGLPYGKDLDIQGREMGQSGVDVKLSKEAVRKFPYSVECKAVEKFNLYEAIEQAKTNVLIDTVWLLFHKKSRNKPIVIMDAEYFFNLLRSYENKN